LITLPLRFCQRDVRHPTVDEKIQANAPKFLILGNALLGGVGLSLLPVSWQIIGYPNPRQSILNPSVIGWRHWCRLVEAANGDIYLVSIWSRKEGQRSATIPTERTPTPSPRQLAQLSRDKPKAASTERCPRHKRCATAPTAV